VWLVVGLVALYVFGGWAAIGDLISAIVYLFVGIVLLIVASEIIVAINPDFIHREPVRWHGFSMDHYG
jgi:hypothetical protein